MQLRNILLQISQTKDQAKRWFSSKRQPQPADGLTKVATRQLITTFWASASVAKTFFDQRTRGLAKNSTQNMSILSENSVVRNPDTKTPTNLAQSLFLNTVLTIATSAEATMARETWLVILVAPTLLAWQRREPHIIFGPCDDGQRPCSLRRLSLRTTLQHQPANLARHVVRRHLVQLLHC